MDEGGFDLHFLETRGISTHANGEVQRLVVHELMQTFHGSGGTAFGFHRHDPAKKAPLFKGARSYRP
jgi:hypothetical protein